MANQKNQVTPMPLNGELNLSKNKTLVSPFTGYNDVNSPIYNNMLSPLFANRRAEAASGNARPYLGKDGVVKDENGIPLLNTKGFKGLKREELTNIPIDTLAVYNENTYISTLAAPDETYSTVLYDGRIESGVAAILSSKAIAAVYTETQLAIVLMPEGIHIFDMKNQYQEIVKSGIFPKVAKINTFYDPLHNWQVISIYEPFSDWEYRLVSSYTEETEAYKAWKSEVSIAETRLESAINDSQKAKEAYESLKKVQDKLYAEKNHYLDEAARWSRAADQAEADKKSHWWSVERQVYYKRIIRDCQSNASYNANKANEKTSEIDAWERANLDDLNKNKAEYETSQGPIFATETLLNSLRDNPPERYEEKGETSGTNPNFHSGRVQNKAFNYIYDCNNNTIWKKNIVMNINELNNGSQAPSADSYIFTGIYDSYLDKDSSGTWNPYGTNYIRYRLGVIPYNIEKSSKETNQDPELANKEQKYFFMLNYTPEIDMNDRPEANIYIPLSGDGAVPALTKTYISNKKNDLMAIDSDVYFSGSGNANKTPIWCKVNFVVKDSPELEAAKLDLKTLEEETLIKSIEKGKRDSEYQAAKRISDADPTEENLEKTKKAQEALVKAEAEFNEKDGQRREAEKLVETLQNKEVNFNDFNTCHDLGDAKYTMYSPWSASPNSGNCMTSEVSGSREITRTYYNYENSSSNISTCGQSADGTINLRPKTGDKIITYNPENIFREVINEGTLANVAICEDKYHIGTLLETPNSIDIDTPIFYRDGKDGGNIVFKTNQNKWISISVTDTVTETNVINDDYMVIYTTKASNCIEIPTKHIRHFGPDWNNRFSLVGSPYEKKVKPISFPAVNTVERGINISDIIFSSGINVSYEVTQDSIVGYNSSPVHLWSNENNITPVGFVSKYDNIDYYFTDLVKDKGSTAAVYYNTVYAPLSDLQYSVFNNIDLANITYPIYITNALGLFCTIKPSNFGRYYLDDGTVFYSLNMYNGKVYFSYYTNSLLDDIREIFMVQGQTFAITKSNYLYSVFVDQYGNTSLSDAIANIDGLIFCGAVPDMAVFYSPMNKTLKSFTADHTLRDLAQAAEIQNVYYTTYSPQTSSIYICTDNGIYVYTVNNQYRLPIYSVKEIYFGGTDEEHTYIVSESVDLENPDKVEYMVTDLIFDKVASPGGLSSKYDDSYEVLPVDLKTRFFGLGTNIVSIIDCVYIRLYTDQIPSKPYISFKEKALTEGVYKTFEKVIDIPKSLWDDDTNTCLIRYQPKYQRSTGTSFNITTNCAIVDISFSHSNPDTVAISKPRLNG